MVNAGGFAHRKWHLVGGHITDLYPRSRPGKSAIEIPSTLCCSLAHLIACLLYTKKEGGAGIKVNLHVYGTVSFDLDV